MSIAIQVVFTLLPVVASELTDKFTVSFKLLTIGIKSNMGGLLNA